MAQRASIFLLIFFTMLLCGSSAAAQQIRRGPKTIIRSGKMQKPDTLPHNNTVVDSAVWAELSRIAGVDDSTSIEQVLQQPQILDSLRATIASTDSAALIRFDSLRIAVDSTWRSATDNIEQSARIDSALIDSLSSLPPMVGVDTTRYKKGWLMSDSMSLSKVCWISTVLPGYGQIYNKQYWKLPILYGTVGAGLALFIHENKRYQAHKRLYNKIYDISPDPDPVLKIAQTNMIRSNTRRQLYLGATIASYLYFIGDAAVSYATNDVSHVKKATTLACICPGAGQIYNKSYWKLPFVVGGFATLVYCIDWNNRGFQRFRKAYSLMYQYEQSTDKDLYPNGSPDEFNGRYSLSFLKNLKDSYRRNRDLCIIITAGVYILQIVDAHVDAHLKDYDISDDLSMNIEPLVDYTFVPSQGGNRAVFGLNMSFNF